MIVRSYLEHLSCDHLDKRGCDSKQRLMDSEEESRPTVHWLHSSTQGDVPKTADTF